MWDEILYSEKQGLGSRFFARTLSHHHSRPGNLNTLTIQYMLPVMKRAEHNTALLTARTKDLCWLVCFNLNHRAFANE